MLECEGEPLKNLSVKCGLFRHNILSSLMFVMAMKPSKLVLRKVKSAYCTKKVNAINQQLPIAYGRSEDL